LQFLSLTASRADYENYIGIGMISAWSRVFLQKFEAADYGTSLHLMESEHLSEKEIANGFYS
jgi:hypothetical protein